MSTTAIPQMLDLHHIARRAPNCEFGKKVRILLCRQYLVSSVAHETGDEVAETTYDCRDIQIRRSGLDGKQVLPGQEACPAKIQDNTRKCWCER